jgi:D-alanine--poly(phosphoribitol) ligase subunit 1
MTQDNYIYNLGQLFKKIAEERADNTAIKAVDGSVFSYLELNLLSNRIAHFLISSGIRKNDIVAILNNKTNTSYAIMIACLKIGAIYTNLDPKSPIERFNKMLTTCIPKLLLYYVGEDEYSVINDFDTSSLKCVDYTKKAFEQEIEINNSEIPEYNNYVPSSTPAYIMFTSGSTGFPKGVVISHANVLNFINWTKLTYNSTVDDVFTNLNPMHFDNSVYDFYASLFTGAKLIPIGENLTRNPRKLLDAINPLEPTIWFSVPSMLVYVLNMRALKDGDLPSLRVVTYGGEGFPKNQLRLLWKKWGHRVTFINVYGPTECTCICSSYIVTDGDMVSNELLPLGPIAPNFYALILDNNEEVEPGDIGELCIGGPNVGIGYFNNSEKTKDVFVQNPNTITHSDTIYKSGDLVRYDSEKKVFLFCGRRDNQIKRMGYRIELEEIENALNSFAFVKECAVVFINNEKYTSKILACINSDTIDESHINTELKNYLPQYMMPDNYLFFDELPKNQNGKIDRLKIKENLNT